MKKETLHDAIQNIDDMFITEAVLVPVQPCSRKPKKKLWLRVASIAASFMALVLCTSMLLKNNGVFENPEKDNPLSTPHASCNVGNDDKPLDPIIDIQFDNIGYWVIEKNHMNHSGSVDLPAEITDDLIGEYLGEGIIAWKEHSPETKVPVYACTLFDCEFLRIVYYNGQYMYMEFSYFADDTIFNPRSLAKMLAVNDSSEIAKITVKKQTEPGTNVIPETKVVKDSSIIDEFWNAFIDAEVIDSDEYRNRVFNYDNLSVEEREVLEERLSLGEEMASNVYIITIFFQNGVQYQLISKEYEDVHYIRFLNHLAVMHDEFKYLVS